MALSLSFLLSFSACGKKDNNTNQTSAPTKSESLITTEPFSFDNSSNTEIVEKGETTTNKNDATKGATSTTKKSETTKPVATTKNPIDKSGLNNKPSNVENATSSDELKNVAPEQAANSSFGTDVSVSTMTETTINPAEYTYVPQAEFESHITGVWKNFQTFEKVKVDAALINEYLNFVCLPLKNSFYEVNCNGYDVAYGYDLDGTYAYMNINWHYYVNEAQYATCRSYAANLVNSTSGSVVERLRQIHDILGQNTAYVVNIDGPYNCLVNHKCDCDGYTAAYMICMDLLGIPSKAYTTSTHIFNCVQISGKWYVVDATWDDQTDYGFIYTRYFLTGSEKYSSYPILASLLNSTDYNCSRKITVTDDAKFRAFANIPEDVTYTLNDDSTVSLSNGYKLKFS
ncbi:MAG: hypothetical protein PUD72_08270 [Oscillospiraceae bacterium]|nr:hypothetical protein [Oscillospiraceae bacterium]